MVKSGVFEREGHSIATRNCKDPEVEAAAQMSIETIEENGVRDVLVKGVSHKSQFGNATVDKCTMVLVFKGEIQVDVRMASRNKAIDKT